MTAHIEDYALIGDLRTAALIGVDGSIDWLALPRFDSPAIHAALLGTAEHGHWALAPVAGRHCARRSYRSGTLILETDWITEAGAVRVTDFMDPTSPASQVIRLVEGLMGEVAMATTLRPRVSFTLTHTTGGDAPLPDPTGQLASTDAFWTDWSGRSTYTGRWAGEVTQSLVFLKALTYAPTGGILAAATTSLPEQTLDWLPGHAGSAPVRIGNAAAVQQQNDVWGEALDVLLATHDAGVPVLPEERRLVARMLDRLLSTWHQPDHGLWEIRGPRRHFLHSKLMAWVGLDRAIAFAESGDATASAYELDRHRRLRAHLRAEILDRGFSSQLRAFAQSYGSARLDASVLLISR